MSLGVWPSRAFHTHVYGGVFSDDWPLCRGAGNLDTPEKGGSLGYRASANAAGHGVKAPSTPDTGARDEGPPPTQVELINSVASFTPVN